jgi:MoxR-like ATPase
VTGVSIFDQKTAEFEFRPGPIVAQTLLADEINRTTPRTQSALLEAMAERRVSADGQTYTLKPPFLVIATQNPVDHEGTFPLPEAQLDRVKRMVQPVLAHRIILRPESRLRKVTAAALLHEVVGDVRVPVPAHRAPSAKELEDPFAE